MIKAAAMAGNEFPAAPTVMKNLVRLLKLPASPRRVYGKSRAERQPNIQQAVDELLNGPKPQEYFAHLAILSAV
jgi:hypothetical protein